MKNLKIKNTRNARSIKMLVLGIAMILAACNGVIKPQFEGIYVNSAGSEFSLANDTLTVEHAEGNEYLIHRRTGFRLLDERGRAGKLQNESEEWTAVYDPEKEVMIEMRHGKTITFNVERTEMTVVRRKYQRIN